MARHDDRPRIEHRAEEPRHALAGLSIDPVTAIVRLAELPARAREGSGSEIVILERDSGDQRALTAVEGDPF